MEDCRVQHVSKASSDELLRKFAEFEAELPEHDRGRSSGKKVGVWLNLKRRRLGNAGGGEGRQSPTRGGHVVVERKSLLPGPTRRSALLRQFKMRRSDLRMREIIINAFLLAKVEKTWRRTVDGATKMFVERHCNQHVRLISDVV